MDIVHVVFVESQTGFTDLRGKLSADKTPVREVAFLTGDALLVLRVSLDEAVFMRMLLHPLVRSGLAELGNSRVGRADDFDCKTCLQIGLARTGRIHIGIQSVGIVISGLIVKGFISRYRIDTLTCDTCGEIIAKACESGQTFRL